MLIDAGHMLMTVENYRLCWISGRTSGGKTALSLKIAEHFLNRDFRLITNMECIWNDKLEGIKILPEKDGHLQAVVVLDEGGRWFRKGDIIEAMASYVAKMNLIFLFPSFWPPHRNAQVVVVQPLFNFKKIGLPIIRYQMTVRIEGFKDDSKFWWLWPQEVYGVYSRQHPGYEPEDIVAHILEQVEAYQNYQYEKYGRARKSAESKQYLRALETEVEGSEVLANELFASAKILERQLEAVEALSPRKSRGRR